MTVERKYARVPEWCMGIIANDCWDGITETERAQWYVFQTEIRETFGFDSTITLTQGGDGEVELFFFPENHVDKKAGNCCTVDILHNSEQEQEQEFTILVEQKVKCWQYITFEITAKSKEEAKAKAIEIYKNGHVFDYDPQYDISDNYEEMTPEENHGRATVGISFHGRGDNFYTDVEDESRPTHSVSGNLKALH